MHVNKETKLQYYGQQMKKRNEMEVEEQSKSTLRHQQQLEQNEI